MSIQFFCPYWGSEHLIFADFLDRVQSAGYAGVEMSLPFDESSKQKITGELAKRNLQLIAHHWETIDVDFETHKKKYEERLRNLASVQPVLINSQTGKDFYSLEQNCALISLAQKISNETGVKIIHETHRGKFSFAAHVTKMYLEKLATLQLTFDASHWCNVAETMLVDQPDALALAIARTEHIHTRVGCTQAAQVSDPRAPEWQEALDTHLRWWDRIVARCKQEGKQVLTMTTEFGPAPYLPLLPYTKMPLVDQWEINIFMKDLLSNRYSTLVAQ